MILFAEDIYKSFPGTPPLDLLQGISLQVNEGETIAIMGQSGEGKSTLLHILATLEAPTKGKVYICGKLPPKDGIAKMRNQHIGLIFQSYHLLDDFTVLENVTMPLRIGRKKGSDPAHALLKEVGLEGKEGLLAKYLSGGEKQRVAIARALVNGPRLLLADEPTGNLDYRYSQDIQNLLLNTAKKHNTALIVVTHDEEFARKCDQLFLLKEGRLYSQLRPLQKLS